MRLTYASRNDNITEVTSEIVMLLYISVLKEGAKRMGKKKIRDAVPGIVFGGTLALLAALAVGVTVTAEGTRGRKTCGQSLAETLAGTGRFAEYEDCGLSYDASLGCLVYEGERVGYFHDETAPGVYNHMVDRKGSVGIRAARDRDWRLTGLEPVEIPDQDESPVREGT